GKFKTLIDREANLANFILKLEKACSLAFAFSIRTVLAVLGLGVLFLTVFIPAAYYSELKILGYLYISLLIIYLIDGVLMGYLRKQTWSVGWYYPIYQLFSVITLSFLYRRLILALLKNLKPKV